MGRQVSLGKTSDPPWVWFFFLGFFLDSVFSRLAGTFNVRTDEMGATVDGFLRRDRKEVLIIHAWDDA